MFMKALAKQHGITQMSVVLSHYNSQKSSFSSLQPTWGEPITPVYEASPHLPLPTRPPRAPGPPPHTGLGREGPARRSKGAIRAAVRGGERRGPGAVAQSLTTPFLPAHQKQLCPSGHLTLVADGAQGCTGHGTTHKTGCPEPPQPRGQSSSGGRSSSLKPVPAEPTSQTVQPWGTHAGPEKNGHMWGRQLLRLLWGSQSPHAG